MTNEQLDKIIDTLCDLIKRYSHVYRKTTQPFTLEDFQERDKNFVYNPEDILIRERLIEHIGSLPVVATTLYPYIKDEEVHLGEALTMLAVHDIGELVTGDEIAFKKRENDEEETKQALLMLDPMYHKYYLDIENLSTKTGKFAKAIDKITGDLFDFLTPIDENMKRFRHYMNIEPSEIVSLFIKHKRPYMLWNPFMEALHIRLIDRLEKIVENRFK